MTLIHLLKRRRLWFALLIGVVGCGTSDPADDRLRALDPTELVPVTGVVTISGKPVATVVVTFLPPSGPALATAETDKDGKYVLRSMGGEGALPGEYKVALSYMVSAEGEPQGASARTSLIQGRAMLSAKELLPAEYADLGRTKFSRTVGPQGGTFDFDLPVTLPAAPEKSMKKADDAKPAEKKADEAKPTEKKADEAKPTEKKPAGKSATEKK